MHPMSTGPPRGGGAQARGSGNPGFRRRPGQRPGTSGRARARQGGGPPTGEAEDAPPPLVSHPVLYCLGLYRQKKLKSWIEGRISHRPGSRKVTLLGEDGAPLEATFLPASAMAAGSLVGVRLDFERYIVELQDADPPAVQPAMEQGASAPPEPSLRAARVGLGVGKRARLQQQQQEHPQLEEVDLNAFSPCASVSGGQDSTPSTRSGPPSTRPMPRFQPPRPRPRPPSPLPPAPASQQLHPPPAPMFRELHTFPPPPPASMQHALVAPRPPPSFAGWVNEEESDSDSARENVPQRRAASAHAAARTEDMHSSRPAGSAASPGPRPHPAAAAPERSVAVHREAWTPAVGPADSLDLLEWDDLLFSSSPVLRTAGTLTQPPPMSPPPSSSRTSIMRASSSSSSAHAAPPTRRAGCGRPPELERPTQPRRAPEPPRKQANSHVKPAIAKPRLRPSAPSPEALARPCYHPTASALYFPVRDVPTKFGRHVPLPSTYASLAEYAQCVRHAVLEQVQLSLCTCAALLAGAHRPPRPCRSEADFRAKGLSFHYGTLMKKGQDEGVYELVLDSKDPAGAYAKDMIWCVMDEDLGAVDARPTLLCSTFYGSASIELGPLPAWARGGLVGARPTTPWSSWERVAAVACYNVSTDFAVLGLLQEVLEGGVGESEAGALKPALQHPLLPWLLDPRLPPPPPSPPSPVPVGAPTCTAATESLLLPGHADDVARLVEGMCAEFTLNEDQAHVLHAFGRSLLGPNAGEGEASTSPPPHPITLVHGVFGAGKSYLVAVLVLLCERLQPWLRDAPNFRILISSMSNVAVDRVLLSLLALGYTSLARVGSVKKIAKAILPYSSLTGTTEEVAELKTMLQEEGVSGAERRLIRQALASAKLETHKSDVLGARVIGVTCAAASFEVLADVRASVLILDECSQMTEPLSLLPLLRFRCERLVCVGDPQQLAPTIPFEWAGGVDGGRSGLERTMFERLATGIAPTILRTQYRCHPAISGIASRLFYRGALRDGAAEGKCGPFVSGANALAWVDLPRGQEEFVHASYQNPQEAKAILAVLAMLYDKGVRHEDMGVICLYKAQAALIRAQAPSPVKVSTVDAFQGEEREVILLATVRTKYTRFMEDPRRINVALTRAKRHLFVFGHAQVLMASGLWGHVLSCCASCATLPEMLHELEAGEGTEGLRAHLAAIAADKGGGDNDEDSQGEVDDASEDTWP